MSKRASRAKRKIPGQVVELKRDTSQGAYFMRPGDDTRELTGYMFARALLESGMVAHVSCMMPNDCRTLATDPTCRRSGFMRDFHSNLARKRNLQLGRGENLWKAAKPGDTAVLDIDDILQKTVDAILEPVARGCVDTVAEWSGFQILPRDWGKPIKFDRPDLCGPDMPETLEFVPMPPPGFDHLPLEEVIEFFERLVAEGEERYRQEREREPLGIAHWEAIDPFLTPRREPDAQIVSPRFSAADPDVLAEAIKCERKFRRDHWDCSLQFRQGKRTVRFPSGTCHMVRIAGVATLPVMRGDPHEPQLTWSAAVHETWARLR